MSSRFPEPILHIPLQQLGLSQELTNLALDLGFFCLADLLKMNTRVLLKFPGFTTTHLYEYINFLEERQLGKYIDP